MANDNKTIRVEIIERDLVNLNLKNRELIRVDFKSLDSIFRSCDGYLSELNDVNISNISEGDVLIYDSSTQKFINTNLTNLIDNYLVTNEVPSKQTVRQYSLTEEYQSGSLQVFINGLKEKDIIEDSTSRFSFPYDTDTLDNIEVNYIKKVA